MQYVCVLDVLCVVWVHVWMCCCVLGAMTYEFVTESLLHLLHDLPVDEVGHVGGHRALHHSVQTIIQPIHVPL